MIDVLPVPSCRKCGWLCRVLDADVLAAAGGLGAQVCVSCSTVSIVCSQSHGHVKFMHWGKPVCLTTLQ